MKAAITGHTRGLGKSLTSVFPDNIGFSRSNGYDLHFYSKRVEMINLIHDCDIFINNAPLGWNQTTLLYDIWPLWKDKNKIIINIGSNASEHIHSSARPYSVQKTALDNASLQLQHSMSACKVLLLKPGYIDTPSVSEVQSTKINPDELANFIKELVEQKNKSFWIPTITIYPK